jgi:hypothetical protein
MPELRPVYAKHDDVFYFSRLLQTIASSNSHILQPFISSHEKILLENINVQIVYE